MSAALRPRHHSGLPTPESTAPLAGRLRVTIGRLARLLRQQDTSGYGQTSMSALSTVAAHGPLTLGELAARERVAPPSITKVVDKLVNAGFVAREVDPRDRRITRVSLTRQGRRHLDASRQARTEWLAARLDGLTGDELARLAAAIDVLERLVATPGADPR